MKLVFLLKTESFGLFWVTTGNLNLTLFTIFCLEWFSSLVSSRTFEFLASLSASRKMRPSRATCKWSEDISSICFCWSVSAGDASEKQLVVVAKESPLSFADFKCVSCGVVFVIFVWMCKRKRWERRRSQKWESCNLIFNFLTLNIPPDGVGSMSWLTRYKQSKTKWENSKK